MCRSTTFLQSLCSWIRLTYASSHNSCAAMRVPDSKLRNASGSGPQHTWREWSEEMSLLFHRWRKSPRNMQATSGKSVKPRGRISSRPPAHRNTTRLDFAILNAKKHVLMFTSTYTTRFNQTSCKFSIMRDWEQQNSLTKKTRQQATS